MPRINVKDKRKQQLMDANIASIAKRGLSETTITHVSQGAGMSRGIVNFYFTTKEMMMQETCQYLAEEYAGAWERATQKVGEDAPALDQLKAIAAQHFTPQLCSQKKLSVWVAFWGHASSHAEYKKIVAAQNDAFLAKLKELWGKVAAPAVSPDVFAGEFFGLIRDGWLSYLLSSQSVERESLIERLKAYIDRASSVAQGAAAPQVVERIVEVEKLVEVEKIVEVEKVVERIVEVEKLVEVPVAASVADAETAPSATVTDLQQAKQEKAQKRKPKAQEDEQPVVADLFAF